MSRTKILLVDDDNLLRHVFREALEPSEFDVIEASSYEQAMQSVDASVKLALVDIVLEGESGMEVLSYLRQQHPLCPVIIISGHANKNNAIDALRKGAVDYLEKPVNLNELKHVVEHWLSFYSLKAENIRLLEDQMSEERKSLQIILDNAPVGIWRMDTNSRIDFINPVFCNAVGVAEQCFLQAEHYFQLLPEDVSRNCMISDKKCFDSREQVSSIEEIPCVDGKLHSFEIIKAPIINSQGVMQGLVGLATDITESRQTEKALQQQVHKLERFNTMSVGRELRMIELKKEINALLNELGREAKYTIHSISGNNSEAVS